MATEPPPATAKPGRPPRRPRHFARHRFARAILVVLAPIGVVALALLVLGRMNVEVVSRCSRWTVTPGHRFAAQCERHEESTGPLLALGLRPERAWARLR